MNDKLRTLGATNHSEYEREVYDFYATDPQAVNDLLEKIPELGKKGLEVLEPCAGLGHLANRYMMLTKNFVKQSDIISRSPEIEEIDYMKADYKDKYDLILTNFPYQEANKNNPIGFSELLGKALNDVKAGGYVCSFQRLLQLESRRRYEKIYGIKRPFRVYVYSHRISCQRGGNFDNKQSSAIAYCWMIWHKDKNGIYSNQTTELEWIY